jgi:hypothetical protein
MAPAVSESGGFRETFFVRQPALEDITYGILRKHSVISRLALLRQSSNK